MKCSVLYCIELYCVRHLNTRWTEERDTPAAPRYRFSAVIGHLLFKELWVAKGPTYIHCVTHSVITESSRELWCDYRLFCFSVTWAASTGSCFPVNGLRQRRIRTLWRCTVVVMWIRVVPHTLCLHTQSSSVCHVIPTLPVDLIWGGLRHVSACWRNILYKHVFSFYLCIFVELI